MVIIEAPDSPIRMNTELYDTLKRLLAQKHLEPYIRHIRFPYYKNLEEGLRLNFEFPLTALVGQNGSNKTAILRALYGAPGNKSPADFWFSTKIDPIEDDGNRNRFIYGYYQPTTDDVVEVIKTRIKRERKPENWEPSRPILSDGMKKMPALNKGEPLPTGRTQTRWDVIEKDVVYIDFRAAISAYDKYFYHGDLNLNPSFNTKQDFIRRRSQALKESIQQHSESYQYYRLERIIENRELSPEEVAQASFILGITYESIHLIKHRFFNGEGYTVILNDRNVKYSEAFAGSGEIAVVMLVLEVLNAKARALVLLDEPEVSLHPGAQHRLTEFLLNQIKIKKIQVILSTHSPAIIEGLPKEAIKVLTRNPMTGKVQVKGESFPEEAFFHLGQTNNDKIVLLVEDQLSKAIIEYIASQVGEAFYKQFDVIFVPGGASSITTQYLPAFAAVDNKNVFVILDGDQKFITEPYNPDSIPVLDNHSLGQKIKDQTGSEIKFPIDGGLTGGNLEQLYTLQRNFLKYWQSHVFYLPCGTPEELIWKNMMLDGTFDLEDHSDYKRLFTNLTKIRFGIADFLEPSSDNICSVQREQLATIEKGCEAFQAIERILRLCLERRIN